MPITKFYLTDKGANLYAKNLAGAAMNFTKVQIGKGDVPAGTNIVTTTAMYDLVKTLPISEITKSPKQAQIKFQFTNSDISVAFLWKEIGIFATDPDEGEILYLYGNAGTEADSIPAYSTQAIEFLYTVICKVANSDTVTATIEKGLIYIAQSERNVPDGVADYNTLQAFMNSKGTAGGLALYDTLKAFIDSAGQAGGIALFDTLKAFMDTKGKAGGLASYDSTIQSATLGGAAVPKSGTILQLPAYPTSLPANGGNATYANTAGSAPANGGTANYAHYSSHAVGSGGAALRNITMSTAGPSGGSDGDVWHQYS